MNEPFLLTVLSIKLDVSVYSFTISKVLFTCFGPAKLYHGHLIRKALHAHTCAIAVKEELSLHGDDR